MGEIDAAGEMVTGTLLGRAVESRAGEGHDGTGMCLNCGTALIGQHCHECGQSGHVHRSLGAIGHEILHGVAHFEGKLWRTLPLLAWRPGELTRRYIRGERARFVSPMAIFLFSIFAMFAAFSMIGLSVPTDVKGGGGPDAKVEEARKDLAKNRAEAVEKRDEAKNAERRTRYAQRIAVIDEKLQVLSRYPASATEPEMRAELTEQRAAAAARLATLPRGHVDRQGLETELQILDRMLASTPSIEGGERKKTGWLPLDHGIDKWEKNPSLMLYKLQASVYKFSWLLIPLSLPFVWLLFAWKREYKLYDHTVFITYSIAFMSLLFIVLTAASAIGVGGVWIALATFVVPFVHIFRQLKQAYALRWWSALLRAIVLSFLIGVVLILFLLLLVLLGMSG